MAAIIIIQFDIGEMSDITSTMRAVKSTLNESHYVVFEKDHSTYSNNSAFKVTVSYENAPYPMPDQTQTINEVFKKGSWEIVDDGAVLKFVDDNNANNYYFYDISLNSTSLKMETDDPNAIGDIPNETKAIEVEVLLER